MGSRMEIIETFSGTPPTLKVEKEDLPLLQKCEEIIKGTNFKAIRVCVILGCEYRRGAKPETDEQVVYYSEQEEDDKVYEFSSPADEVRELFCEVFAVILSTGRYKLGITDLQVVDITYYAPCDSNPMGAFEVDVMHPEVHTVKLTKEATVEAEVYVEDTDGGRVPYEYSTDGNDITITIDFKEMRRGIIKECIQKLNEGEEDDN